MSITVPPDTHSWAEAVAEGFYGERTNPFPDELYTVVEEVGLSPVVLTALEPATCAVNVAPGDVDFVGTGMNDPRVKHAKLVARMGVVLAPAFLRWLTAPAYGRRSPTRSLAHHRRARVTACCSPRTSSPS